MKVKVRRRVKSVSISFRAMNSQEGQDLAKVVLSLKRKKCAATGLIEGLKQEGYVGEIASSTPQKGIDAVLTKSSAFQADPNSRRR